MRGHLRSRAGRALEVTFRVVWGLSLLTLLAFGAGVLLHRAGVS